MKLQNFFAFFAFFFLMSVNFVYRHRSNHRLPIGFDETLVFLGNKL